MQLFLFSSLARLAVAEINRQMKIGYIYRGVIDADKLAIIGFLVKKNLLARPLFVSAEETVDLEKSGLLIQSEDSLVPPSEIVRAARILSHKVDLIGLPVLTKDNRYLGRVYDFSFEIPTYRIASFYLIKFFRRRIIGRSKIIKITPKALVVESDIELVGTAELA